MRCESESLPVYRVYPALPQKCPPNGLLQRPGSRLDPGPTVAVAENLVAFLSENVGDLARKGGGFWTGPPVDQAPAPETFSLAREPSRPAHACGGRNVPIVSPFLVSATGSGH
jgi:hypothetical protein